jgi:hypothetical protein
MGIRDQRQESLCPFHGQFRLLELRYMLTFKVGNVPHWTTTEWQTDMRRAQDVSIDAFVLNMAESDPDLERVIETAFSAAFVRKFQLLFSFE